MLALTSNGGTGRRRRSRDPLSNLLFVDAQLLGDRSRGMSGRSGTSSSVRRGVVGLLEVCHGTHLGVGGVVVAHESNFAVDAAHFELGGGGAVVVKALAALEVKGCDFIDYRRVIGVRIRHHIEVSLGGAAGVWCCGHDECTRFLTFGLFIVVIGRWLISPDE
ncbi:Uncharacterised protein [Mycobacteroides abscessus subsp. massiliense]|nr:Uncharacterised protein [Mycobacteroides abscessus subsp. massiliense]SKT97187.1 Uncharacterised protein [Mycobacteroides abscessus subsp. massiliense]